VITIYIYKRGFAVHLTMPRMKIVLRVYINNFVSMSKCDHL